MKRNSAPDSSQGFTLVELLVVIAIIGVLVGLLVPAVNFARETARKAECLNNLRGFGQALLLHETDKGHFPGRVNMVRANHGNQIPVSWVTKLLPYIEKGNVWELVINDPIADDNPDDATRYAVSLETATCPSDPPTGSKIPSPTSYIINTGIWDRELPSSPAINDIRANGISHDFRRNSTQSKVDIGYLAKNDGATSTLLLSENVNAVTWVTLEEGLHGMIWTLQSQWLDDNDPPKSRHVYQINKGKDLLDQQLYQMSESGDEKLESFARPSSNHSGGVNAIFCDGHGKFINEDINPLVYAQLLSASKFQARHPARGKNWLQDVIPMQRDVTLSDGDY